MLPAAATTTRGGIEKTKEVAMTTVEAPSARTGRSVLPIAVVAAVAALVLMLIGTYVHTPYKAKGSGEWGLSTQDLNQIPLLAGFAIVGRRSCSAWSWPVDSVQRLSGPPGDPSSSPAWGWCRSWCSGPACR
jgi:hypothetical protein